MQNLVRAFTPVVRRGRSSHDRHTAVGSVTSRAAFGEDITTFTNAVIRGAAGETEALKRFGVTASVQGNNITVQFRDFTRTTKRNFTDVTEVFKELSALNFEGAMTRQMETIIGSISNLKDAGSLLAFAIGERGGMNEAFRELVETLIVAVQATDRYAEAIGGGFAKAMNLATGTVENMVEHSEGIIKSLQAMGRCPSCHRRRIRDSLGTRQDCHSPASTDTCAPGNGCAWACCRHRCTTAAFCPQGREADGVIWWARRVRLVLRHWLARLNGTPRKWTHSPNRSTVRQRRLTRRNLFSTGIDPHILNLQAAADTRIRGRA